MHEEGVLELIIIMHERGGLELITIMQGGPWN
jgi:hypothetical protein